MTRRYEVIKKTGVFLMEGGQSTMRYVGIATCAGRPDIFGLLDRDLEMTHMCYGLDYMDPADCLKFCRDRGTWFFFDAGTTCTEIKISADWLEKAFRELELIT
jgi:hypothetical protein